jgi:hypothetical protein
LLAGPDDVVPLPTAVVLLVVAPAPACVGVGEVEDTGVEEGAGVEDGAELAGGGSTEAGAEPDGAGS